MAHGNIRPKAVSVKDILVRKEGERTGCSFYYSIFWYSIYYVVIWETVSQNRKISLSQCIVKKNILFKRSWMRHGSGTLIMLRQKKILVSLYQSIKKCRCSCRCMLSKQKCYNIFDLLFTRSRTHAKKSKYGTTNFQKLGEKLCGQLLLCFAY